MRTPVLYEIDAGPRPQFFPTRSAARLVARKIADEKQGGVELKKRTFLTPVNLAVICLMLGGKLPASRVEVVETVWARWLRSPARQHQGASPC